MKKDSMRSLINKTESLLKDWAQAIDQLVKELRSPSQSEKRPGETSKRPTRRKTDRNTGGSELQQLKKRQRRQ